MKTILFFFTLLAGCAAFAQATVTPLSVDYDNQQVTFGVEWTTAANNRVWVFVDFCSVAGATPSTFAPATISPVSVAGGSYDGQNGRGFYVYGNSTTVTATLSNITGKFNWCAYGSDYPPNMVLDEQIYYFKGTPPFILKEANGGVHEITQTSMPKANLTFVPVSITDKTECPGGLQEVIGTCAYTGTDWYADPEHKCQQRISGAQNWEAYIKDPRDDELYRIVQYSDGVWWWADDYRGSYGYERTCSGLRLYSATDKSLACPNGWILPSANEYKNRFTRPATNDNWGGALNPTKFCYNKDNGCFIYDMPIRCDVVATDLTTAVWSFCDSDMTINSVALTPGQIRCFHQL